ncbi:hypothetical protein OC926_12625 [Pseudomonas peradeniyensis]|uniref:hypothetical protein n=1 Tax=Pseudomonas TaxID=286 RepID=UPI0012E0DC92|nr:MULTISPECIES: hypothetical protein [Pseudomonas]MCU7280690.1 hypothetical protein [Pseudomonas peradeniyensis]QZA52937.1 hypothetical protein K2O50_18245 [Pseudomonas sp. 2hn]
MDYKEGVKSDFCRYSSSYNCSGSINCGPSLRAFPTGLPTGVPLEIRGRRAPIDDNQIEGQLPEVVVHALVDRVPPTHTPPRSFVGYIASAH